MASAPVPVFFELSCMWYHQLDAAGRRAYVFIGGRSYRERVVLCGVLSETPPDGDRNSFSVCRYLLAGMMPFTNWEQLQLMLRVLRGLRWRVFASLFWSGIAGIVMVRIVIITFRVRSILAENNDLLMTINHIHIGYFGLIALLECLSAYFLMVLFTSAKASSAEIARSGGLFQYLARSTEMRVALLALQGVLRAVTHSFKTAGQTAENIATQLDRFFYAVFCLYSMVLYIDLLSSKLKFSAGSQDYPSSRDRYHQNSRHQSHFPSSQRDEFGQTKSRHTVVINGGKNKTRSDSTDQIIECNSSTGDASIKLDDMDIKGIVIKQRTFELWWWGRLEG
ncbi:unnamed protein product [Fusarium graminearum]|nr:unnamed protein product [Fusarium graminearum]VTO85165.1 unnamed protein product [Fusarium graminearum]